MRVLLGILAAGALIQAAAAQTGPVVSRAPAQAKFASGAASGAVVILPGYAATVEVTEPFASLIIGDPDLIDAMAITDKSFVIKAKGAGSGDTNVIVVNATGQQVYNLTVKVAPSGAKGGGGMVKVHTGGKSRLSIHDFSAYSCADTYCARLPPNKERIYQPPPPNIIIAPTTNINTAPAEQQ